MEAALYRFWKRISAKESIRIAIDGSSYSENDLRDITVLGVFRQFEMFYIAGSRIKNKSGPLPILIPRVVRGPREGDCYVILEDNDTGEEEISGYIDKEVGDRFSAELVGSVFIADLIATRLDRLTISDRMFFCEKAGQRDRFIGSLSACMSAARAWINRRETLDLRGGLRIGISKETTLLGALPKLLPNYKRAWRAAVVSNKERCPVGDGAAYDYFASIFSRAAYLIATRDLLEVLKLTVFDKEAKHQYSLLFMAIYHLDHFLMLLTAVIESIEVLSYWRICDKQSKPDAASFRTNRRDDKERHNRKFHKAISDFNQNLSNFIDSPKSQSLLKIIYKLRNRVAHSIVPKQIFISGGGPGGLAGDLLSIIGDEQEMMADFACEHSLSSEQLLEIGIELGRGSCGQSRELLIEPILFTRYMLNRAVDFIEILFGYLRIEDKLIATKEERNKYETLLTSMPRRTAFELGDKMHRALAFIEASHS